MQTTENSPESANGVQFDPKGREKPIRLRYDNELASFGVAVLLNLAALGLSLVFPAMSRPYYLFIGATALVTWHSGWRPGTFSGILSAVLAAMFVLPSSTQVAGTVAWGNYAGFIAVMVLVFTLAALLRRKDLELDELYLHFAGVVQISEDAIITVDHEQNITMFNAGAEMIFGYTSAEMRGKSINLLLPEEYREMHSAHLRAFAKSPDVLRPMTRRGSNIYGQRSDGSHFPAEASISKFDAAGKQILTVRLRDISERVASDHRLRQLASIVESSHDAIISVDLEGVLRSWNQGAEAMYGYTAAEVVGKSEAVLLPPDCDDEQLLNLQRMSKGVKTNYETFRMRKDGTQIDVALTVSPIHDKQGVVVGASCIARDITERLRLEQLLHRSQKMEAVGLLAGGVAHDFNNLLAIIIGHAYLLQVSGSENEQTRKAGEEIINACEKASALTRQLLAFGRKQIMNPKILDLNEITSGIGKMIPRLLGEDVEVRIDQGDELKLLRADPSQLEQIIMNLAVNARDAMPDGGKLTIKTSNVTFDAVAAHHNNVTPGDYVLLAVSDTGEGMSHETRSHIFEPFFTTKEVGKGTGLGLATVYGIVSQNKGHILVYSELGQGTTFKIYFPAVSGAATKPALVAPRREHTLQGEETVLLVEDQEPLRELFTQVLRNKGYKVLSASGGQDALEQATKENSPINLLLTDVMMPGMRGDRVAEALSAAYPNMRVVFMSGHTDSALLHNGTLPADVVFLQKPFTPDAMLRLIRDVLDESGSHENDRRDAV